MKKYLLLLPAALFPYSLLFELVCIFTGFLMDSVFHEDVLYVLLYTAVFYVVALICSLIFMILGIVKKWDSVGISRANMIVKLVQIPAYVVVFALGVILSITIIGVMYAIVFFIFDCMTILLTGLIGVCAVVRCRAEGKLSKSDSIAFGILQFIFCIDVIISILVFVKAKKIKKIY